MRHSIGREHATALAHITDAHVTPSGRRTAVLKDKSVLVLRDLVDQLVARNVDSVLFGGDNIDNHGDGENDLAAFFAETDRLSHWLCVVGNHEAASVRPGSGRFSKEEFAERMNGHGIGPGRLRFSEAVGNVRIIGIDTTLVGTAGGYVNRETLDFLAHELREAGEEHIVVLGHHLLAAPWAPYQLDAWDSDYLVANRDVVISLLATDPRVRAYLCGHHHASRIHRIAGRGEGGGFYHILSPSPVAYPHGARILRFESQALVIERVRPRCDGLMQEGLEAVLEGRKALRFQTLGTRRSFADYVAGRASDNEVALPYGDGSISRDRPGMLTASTVVEPSRTAISFSPASSALS